MREVGGDGGQERDDEGDCLDQYYFPSLDLAPMCGKVERRQQGREWSERERDTLRPRR